MADALSLIGQQLAKAQLEASRLAIALKEAVEFANQDGMSLTYAGRAMVARWEAALCDYLAACERGDFSEAADLKEAMADVRHSIFLTGCIPDYE